MNKGLLKRLAQVSLLALTLGGLAVQAQAVFAEFTQGRAANSALDE